MEILHNILLGLFYPLQLIWKAYYHANLTPKIIIGVVVTFFVGTSIVYVIAEGHLKGFVRGMIAYHHPNRFLGEETTSKLFFTDEQESAGLRCIKLLPALFLFILAAKYLSFLLLLHVFIMLALFFLFLYLIYLLTTYGSSLLLMILLAIIAMNVLYFTQSSIGFPHFTPHMTGWFGIMINPTSDDVNINLYVYVLVLVAAYYSFLKYVINFFWWRWCETPESVLAGKGIANNENIGNESIAEFTSDNTVKSNSIIGDLRLIGFSNSAIDLLRKECSAETLSRVINRVRTTDERQGSPKAFVMHQLFGEKHDLEKW